MTTNIVPQSKIGIENFQLNELRLPVIMLHFSGIKSANFYILAEFRGLKFAF